MKALTFRGKHQIRFEDTPDPQIESPDDVIVKVKLCAICGSDLHVYHEYEKGLDQGTPMGHEFMGEIVESGKNVKAFKRGDLVLSPFSVSCGRCYFCKIGLSSRCVLSQLFGWVNAGHGLAGVQARLYGSPWLSGHGSASQVFTIQVVAPALSTATANKSPRSRNPAGRSIAARGFDIVFTKTLCP